MITQKYINDISYKIIGCAIEVHKHLGPVLLESVYEACFIDENTGYVAGGMGGSNGIVLKTIDGESFTELNFPFYNAP